jgi:hypothetical protein
MTTSTDGILAYGFDLGEYYGFEWDDDTPRPAWVDSDDYEAAENALIAANGFTDPEPDFGTDREGWLSWSQRRDDAKKALGIEMVMHCSDSCTMWILAAKHYTASRGYPKEVNLDLPEGADERLAWAVDVLGLYMFEGQQPKWLLASWWG